MSDLQLHLLIWTPILGIVGGLLVGIALYLWRRPKYDPYNDDRLGATFLGAFGGLALLILALMWFPYDMDYLAWQEVSGEVERIDSRLVPAGDGMQEKYVVEIDGQPYGCLDTRCAAVEPGDVLTLNCHKVWEWASTHGWDCRFVAHEEGTRP